MKADGQLKYIMQNAVFRVSFRVVLFQMKWIETKWIYIFQHSYNFTYVTYMIINVSNGNAQRPKLLQENNLYT